MNDDQVVTETFPAAKPIRKAKAKPSRASANGKAKKAKNAVKCMCGCGETTGSRFAPGHDAKLKSRLLTAHRTKGLSDRQRQLVKELGWSKHMTKAPRS